VSSGGGVHLQIFPVNYAYFFFTALEVQVHPLHPWLRLYLYEYKRMQDVELVIFFLNLTLMFFALSTFVQSIYLLISEMHPFCCA